MNIGSALGHFWPGIEYFLEGHIAALEALSRDRKIRLEGARILVSWGGGKDSTLALILAKAIADHCGCELSAYTMYHPGLTSGVYANIDKVVDSLRISHQFRFLKRTAIAPLKDCEGEWNVIYRKLWAVLRSSPRFMCVACNFGATVTEYSALVDSGAQFHVTGNPTWELELFDQWLLEIRGRTSNVVFPSATGNRQIDYYVTWWIIYSQLLKELGVTDSDIRSRYLYDYPAVDDAIGRVLPFCVITRELPKLKDIEKTRILQEVGWRLPTDIQGGTESDCGYTALIAMLNIQKKGLQSHLSDLEEAVRKFEPLEEMAKRSKAWSISGESDKEGKRLFDMMGIDDNDPLMDRERGGVARALLEKLFPIR